MLTKIGEILILLTALAFGLACLFERDMIWMLYEYDSRLTGSLIERTPRWEQQATIMGFFFIVLGIIGFGAGLRG
jgi:hypothetical protein